MLAWEQVTNAVNAVPPVVRTVAEVKKNWFDLKVMPKKKILQPTKGAYVLLERAIYYFSVITRGKHCG